MPKILFIDDEQENCQIAERYFRKKGFDFIGETDPVNSLNAYKDHSPQIVLIDMNLGSGVTGIDVLSSINSEKKGDTRIIMLSGLLQVEYFKNQAMLLGADDFLVKPIDPNLILDKIQSYLQAPPEKV